MNNIAKILLACVLLGIATPALAQDDTDELRITALEALLMAPPERAMPIVQRVLAGDGSDEVKERALFVLSQIDTPEAQALLVDTARNSSGELKFEAIRMIGIGGNAEAMSALTDLYASGDADVREAVLEAYLIADDTDAVYNIARNTEDPDEFEEAVEILAAMGAVEELRSLSDRSGMGDALIEAYMIAGDDETVLQLFREAQDPAEKRRLLEILVMMDSEAVWDIIDQTLEQ